MGSWGLGSFCVKTKNEQSSMNEAIFIHLSIDKKLSHTISCIYPTGVNST